MIIWVFLAVFLISLTVFILSLSKRPVRQGRLIISLILTLIGLGGMIVYLSVVPPKNADQSNTSDENQQLEQASYEEIYYSYKENELVADEKYKNNRYQVTATINGMTNDGLFNLTDGATLTMETQIDNTIVIFYAEFEKEQEEALKTVKVGDTITFEGECLSAGTWVECELIMQEE